MKMLYAQRGLTLIELLVVVLIIGILSAIAMPQYQLAVEKARAMQAVIAVRALSNAAELYYLEHGAYPISTQIENLDWINERFDIQLQAVSDFQFGNWHNSYIFGTRRNSSQFYYTISKTLRGDYYWDRDLTCHVQEKEKTNSMSSRICKSLCKTDTLKVVWGSGQYGCEIK